VSRSARIILAVGTLAVLVVAFVVLRPGSDNSGPSTTQTTAARTAAGATTAAPEPQPAFAQIRVRGGKPVGGVQKIKLKKGDRARIEVSSPDTTDEIHLHGYDLKRDLKAGGSVRFSFDATSDGIYEIELEGAGVQIGELVVEPG
jgi:FtsP/CotA-like multicopper oxidase with cupredoxin domain